MNLPWRWPPGRCAVRWPNRQAAALPLGITDSDPTLRRSDEENPGISRIVPTPTCLSQQLTRVRWTRVQDYSGLRRTRDADWQEVVDVLCRIIDGDLNRGNRGVTRGSCTGEVVGNATLSCWQQFCFGPIDRSKLYRQGRMICIHAMQGDLPQGTPSDSPQSAQIIPVQQEHWSSSLLLTVVMPLTET